MIPEREREALMRLTMCARGECPMCKYEEQCDNWDFRMELATKNMNILADALCKLSNSEKPNNSTSSKMEQVEDEFKQFDREDLILLIECQKERIAELLADKDTPQTDSEITRNSLRTDCTGCKFVGWYDTDFPCVNCIRKNKDCYTSEQTEREGE